MNTRKLASLALLGGAAFLLTRLARPARTPASALQFTPEQQRILDRISASAAPSPAPGAHLRLVVSNA